MSKKIILNNNFQSYYFIFNFTMSSMDEYQKFKEDFKSIEHYIKYSEIQCNDNDEDEITILATLTLPRDSINQLGKVAFDFFKYGCKIGFEFNNQNLKRVCKEKEESFWNYYYFGYEIDDGINMENLNSNVIRAFELSFNDILDIAKYKWCLENGYLFYKSIVLSKSVVLSKSQKILNKYNKKFNTKVSKIEEFINQEKYYVNMLNRFRYMDYSNLYLNTQHWKHFIKEALRFFNYTCFKCKIIKNVNNKVIMDVHHLTYNNKGRETFNDVVLLCRDCHKALHDKYGGNVTTEQFEKFMLD